MSNYSPKTYSNVRINTGAETMRTAEEVEQILSGPQGAIKYPERTNIDREIERRNQ